MNNLQKLGGFIVIFCLVLLIGFFIYKIIMYLTIFSCVFLFFNFLKWIFKIRFKMKLKKMKIEFLNNKNGY